MIIDWLDAGAERYRDLTCLEDAAGVLKYGEVLAMTRRVAHANLASVGAHAKIGLYSPNCAPGLVAALGIFRSGAAYVPLNARDAVEDNGWFLDFAECELLFAHSCFAAHFARLRELAPRLRQFVCIDRELPGAASLEQWSAAHRAAPVAVRRGPDDIAIIKSTGGTTGRPKGVLQTHRVLETMYRTIEECMPPRGSPVHLVVAPSTHAAGAIAYPLMAHGARHILFDRADPGRILDAIERERVTYLFLPPTVIYRLLNRTRVGGTFLARVFRLRAAPVSVEKLRERSWFAAMAQLRAGRGADGLYVPLPRRASRGRRSPCGAAPRVRRAPHRAHRSGDHG